MQQENYNIGFVSTRFAGKDGVSLETQKWDDVFREMGHDCFYFCGECDRPDDISMVVPEAHFLHPEVLERHNHFYSQTKRSREDSTWIHEKREFFKNKLYDFIAKFELDVLVPQNCLTIPLHIPLGLALTEVIAETGIQTIAHHHDFGWERERFAVNCIKDYMAAAFPPKLPSIQHVVINTPAREALARRAGLPSVLVPNIMNFETRNVITDDYGNDLRERLGINENELFVLQPTRVVRRKGIEHAIELLSKLDQKAHLVISHPSGDEIDEYEKRVRDYADKLGVRIVVCADIIEEHRNVDQNGDKIYSLADIYNQCDLVTFPSLYEGFGNALLEAMYFEKPIVVNRFLIYNVDIRPKGFRCIEFDGYIDDDTITMTKQVLANAELKNDMTRTNFDLARKFYSYPLLRLKLRAFLANAFGPENENHG